MGLPCLKSCSHVFVEFFRTMLQTNTIGVTSFPSSPTASGTNGRHFKYGAQNVVQAGSQFVHYVNTNPTFLNLLGAIGGAGVLAVGVLCFINVFNIIHNPLTYTLNIFYLLFGAVIIVTSLFGSTAISQKIYTQGNFLANPLGRSFFFLYLGCLMTSTGSSPVSPIYLAVGIYLLLLAILSIFIAWRTR